MKFLVSVIDSQTRSPHTPQEIKAIDDFNFGCLFSKIDKFDLIIKLVRAMLLEKHIILIKENVQDIAIIM